MSNNANNIFILHSRPLSESRLLLEILDERLGRLSAVYRLAKKALGRPQLFQLYHTEIRGKNELKSLFVLEQLQDYSSPPGLASYSGLYLNELLYCLLPKEMSVELVFGAYKRALLSLQQIRRYTQQDQASDQAAAEYILRRFELLLFQELGFGLNPSALADVLVVCQHDAKSDKAVVRYDPNEGWLKLATEISAGTSRKAAELNEFSYRDLSVINDFLCDLSMENFRSARHAIKRLNRHIIDTFLQGRKLRSRELFS